MRRELGPWFKMFLKLGNILTETVAAFIGLRIRRDIAHSTRNAWPHVREYAGNLQGCTSAHTK